ncbi:MAG: hypothetical protein Q4C83_02660 [Candidatus Saccharibacteria bacterium]|nr:hypothetical protein [Candidatus Saccharibacteria bacterium]
MKQANQLALSFANDLTAIKQAKSLSECTVDTDDDEIHVQTTGASLTELYESLRKASQNSEENLQLTHAIKRFIERFFVVDSASKLKRPGNMLVTELTMTGYIANDSIKQSLADHISDIIKQGVILKNRLAKNYSRHQIDRWVIRPLAARIESLLRDHSKDQALINLAFNYFLNAIDIEQVAGSRPATYEATLYMAVQKALLGSEEDAIRLSLMDRYGVTAARYTDYARFNMQIDEAIESKLLDTLTRIVNRNGAVFRVINSASQSDDAFDQHLLTEKTFLGPFDAAIKRNYVDAANQVNRGILRSVIFLIITKFIIGIAAEVPYDLLIHDRVMWLPLAVNLLLPPLYMILLRLTLVMPDNRNTKALTREASRILYQAPAKRPFITGYKHHFSKVYNFIYLLVIAGTFTGIGWLLMHFAHFEWIHLIIFFVFISTASFLGFRLSRAIRKIEVGDEAQTTASILRDFIYMPFVAVGQKISETYSRVNIVSRAIDMFIELPLRTILGFMRRWGSFMSAQRDDL